jgi:RHS repeat-associated protein
MKEEVGLGGIYDFNARYYDPAIGRFLSADTIVPGAGNPQAFNRYSFVLNRPLNMVDPTGHDACEEDCDPDSFRTEAYHRKTASGKFASGGTLDYPTLVIIDFGANFGPGYAGQALAHYRDATGTPVTIDIERVLSGSPSHQRVVDKIVNDLIGRANDVVLTSSRSHRVSTLIASRGKNQLGEEDSNWEYATMTSGESTDLIREFNGIEWAGTAQVSATRIKGGWEVSLRITMYAEDPYDWETWDVNKGRENQVSVPMHVSIGPVTLSHSNIASLHKFGVAQEYLRYGQMTFTTGYSLPD